MSLHLPFLYRVDIWPCHQQTVKLPASTHFTRTFDLSPSVTVKQFLNVMRCLALSCKKYLWTGIKQKAKWTKSGVLRKERCFCVLRCWQRISFAGYSSQQSLVLPTNSDLSMTLLQLHLPGPVRTSWITKLCYPQTPKVFHTRQCVSPSVGYSV